MKPATRKSQPEDLNQYIDFLQRTYEESYPNESIGLRREHFSKEIFSSKRIVDYSRDTMKNTDNQKVWFTFGGGKLIGTITIEDLGKECELKGFYVDHEYQGRGIGKSLWKKAKKFAGKKDIILDTYSHNKKSIAIYKKWGFEIDEAKGKFFRAWPEWPKEVKAECIYMRYKNKST